MKLPISSRGFLISILATGIAAPLVYAQTPAAIVAKVSAGAIVGVVQNSTKIPVPGATVTAIRADGGSIRATISGSDGMYSFADLSPGE